MDYPGNVYVVAAPSGAGKSSLVKALMELDAAVRPSVSHTTRPPRGQEKDGREYHFVSDAAFDALIQNEAFLEWATVHGHRYGTSRESIEQRIAQGADVVLEIDYQGALQIKKIFANADMAQDRALSEATAFAIRIDVAEELTRLGAHLEEITQCLNRPPAKEGVGKRLDFLIQELHREANTLGSKSAALEMTRVGVDMKVLIEQMREQVQNLE